MLIVITPASNKRLSTRADLQAAVAGLSDTAADKFLDRAGAMIEGYCGRVLVSETVRQTERGVSTGALILDRWPVSSITSVIEDGTTLSASDYERDGSFLFRLVSDARTNWVADKVVINYVAGYSTVPADLEQASQTLAVSLASSVGRDPTIRSESIPDVRNVSYLDPDAGGGVLPESVVTLLYPYREVRL